MLHLIVLRNHFIDLSIRTTWMELFHLIFLLCMIIRGYLEILFLQISKRKPSSEILTTNVCSIMFKENIFLFPFSIIRTVSKIVFNKNFLTRIFVVGVNFIELSISACIRSSNLELESPNDFKQILINLQGIRVLWSLESRNWYNHFIINGEFQHLLYVII